MSNYPRLLPDVTLKSNVDEIVLNADFKLGDVYLVSADRRYFLTHRIVLVASSDLLASLLSYNCDFCGEQSDDNVVIFFDQVLGHTLQNILKLIYTGSVDGLKTEAEVSELKDLGYQIKLKSSETLVQTASSNSPDSSVWQAFGFKEMDPPQKCLTDIPNFMLSPKQASGHFKKNDLDDSCVERFEYVGGFKTELEDYYEDGDEMDNFHSDNEDPDYTFEEPIDVNSRKKRTTRNSKQLGLSDTSQFSCPMCLQTFGLNSELEEHICEEEPISNSRLKNQATKKRRNKSNTKTTASKSKKRKIKNEVDNEIDFSPSSEMYTKLTCSQCLKIVDTKEDLKLHWVLQHGIAIENFDEQDPSSKENDGEVLPAVEMPMREENGRFYCLSGDCAVKKQSSKWLRGFKEHFMEKHAPENLKTFGCKFCNELFASSGIRNKHQKVHFPKDDSDPLESREETDLLTPLVCLKETDIEVKVNTNKSSDLSQSQSNEIPMREENGRFFCLSGDCEQTGGRSFNWLGGLKEHYNKVHDPDYQKTVPCKYCGMLFASVGLRNKHIKSDHVKEKGESNKISKFTCSVCSEVFNLASSLKIHLLKHPELSVKTGNKVKLRPFHCDQCDKSFVKPCHLRDHQIVHSEERYFICDKCGKSYKEKGELTRHKQIHEDVIVDCEFCELKFVGQYLYSRHLRRKHQSTYTCNDCGKTYGYKYTFDMHMRTHSGERPYVCELCGASYPIQGSLTHHLKASHSNWHKERKKEKQCDQCQRFFYTTHSLNLHIKTVHENVKDYHCAECGNSYKGSTQLKRHMETHSGITINCQYCERKFNSTSYYKKHLKRKHKANDST